MRTVETLALISLTAVMFGACASSHVAEAPNQSPRERTKSNQRSIEADLNRHTNPQPAPVSTPTSEADAPMAAPPPSPTASPAPAPPAASRPRTASGSGSVQGGMLGAVGNRGKGKLTAEGLRGAWKASGKVSIHFAADSTYTKTVTKKCRGRGPCPEDTSSGEFSLRRGKLYLNPTKGNAEIYEARFSGGMLMMKSKAQGKEWAFSPR